jgi:hypothetical protein
MTQDVRSKEMEERETINKERMERKETKRKLETGKN